MRLSATVQKLVSKYNLPYIYPIVLVCLWGIFFLSACSSDRDAEADRLNDICYAEHYKSLDSVRVYADSVINNKTFSSDAHAEAMNNLAFYYLGKMQYDMADSMLHKIYDSTDNQIELCISNIQHMNMCQRKSQNKDYYEYRQKALKNFKRIAEETQYTQRQQRRLLYARSEFSLVSSVYDYYVGKTDESIASLQQLDSLGVEKKDTAQYLAYLYNIGSGGVLTHGTKEDIAQMEYNYLMHCYMLSVENGFVYWQANALQALAEHIIDDGGEFLYNNPSAMHYLNTQSVPDSLLAGNMTERSIHLFEHHGNVYQQAAAWRSLSRCYAALHDYHGSIYALQKATDVDKGLEQAPALMASLYELFSMSFSALNKKSESDYYRNKYLDLYDFTRQDRELEARAEVLEGELKSLNVLLHIIIGVIALLAGILILFVIRRKKAKKPGKYGILATMQSIKDENQQLLTTLEEEEEELEEKCAMMELQLSRQEQDYAEQRARMHLINSLTPLLDRMLHETEHLSQKNESEDVRDERMSYISELIGRINNENDFLTRWIQLKQGELSLHIESFPLQQLFDIVAKGTANFSRQGVTLSVCPTDETIKADRSLTLFMLNTLCDNARKYTTDGGRVTLSAEVCDGQMIEISVADDGCGMTTEQCQHVFDVKAIRDEQLSDTVSAQESKGHGFGLVNCKGIIEKYKKTNSLFSQSTIGVESEVGKGSRFYFRLPRGVQRMVMAVLMFVSVAVSSFASKSAVQSSAQPSAQPATQSGAKKSAQPSVQHGKSATPYYKSLSDSVYSCNVHYRFDDAVLYAKACFAEINKHYTQVYQTSNDTLLLIDPLMTVPAELRWLRDSVDAPYYTILSVRNEVAVAALALNDWKLYNYNNNAYSSLYKELSVDDSLEAYCQQSLATEYNHNVAVGLLIMLILSFIPIFYFAYYRHIIFDFRKELNSLKQDIAERNQRKAELQSRLSRLTFEHDRLHVANNVMSNSFSAIKHETMYFPSRIMQLVREAMMTDVADYKQLDEVARYYRAVYDALSAQAQYNCRHTLSPEVLRDIMLSSMAKLSGQRKADIESDDTEAPYSVYRFTLREIPATTSTARMKDDAEIRMKILTQVTRDLGELYNLRRCGVVVSDNEVVVTAPMQNKPQTT